MSSVHTPEYQFMLRQLRAARERANLTQQQVADALGAHQSYISKCESGERRIDAIELSRFAALYGEPLPYFIPPNLRPAAKKPRR